MRTAEETRLAMEEVKLANNIIVEQAAIEFKKDYQDTINREIDLAIRKLKHDCEILTHTYIKTWIAVGRPQNNYTAIRLHEALYNEIVVIMGELKTLGFKVTTVGDKLIISWKVSINPENC